MANKILVVDDDLNICEVLKLYLENDGYDVKCAHDGGEKIAFVQTQTCFLQGFVHGRHNIDCVFHGAVFDIGGIACSVFDCDDGKMIAAGIHR